MTLFTAAIPVWLNITCGNGHHRDYQVGPQQDIVLNEADEAFDWECDECGSATIKKINICGSSNKGMTTLEEVRTE